VTDYKYNKNTSITNNNTNITTGENFSSTEHFGEIMTSQGSPQNASGALSSDGGLRYSDQVHG